MQVSLWLVAASATLVICAPAVGATSYVLHDLGTFGGSNAYSRGLNDAGVIVGIYQTGPNTDPQNFGFYWDGTFHDLGPGGAMDINNSDTIVGYNIQFRNGGYSTDANQWVNGVATDIGYGYADAINDNGEIMGSTGYETYLLTNGTRTVLSGLNGNLGTSASGINAAGEIAGAAATGAMEGNPPDPVYNAVLWENGQIVDLGIQGSANGLNDSGVVVGDTYAFNNSGGTDTHAFWWAGNAHDLGLGTAVAINNAGTIVGNKHFGNTPYEHAFVYSDGVMQELPYHGIVSEAYAISNTGIISGTEYVSVGHAHAVYWTPVPETGGLAAMAVMLAGFGMALAPRGQRGTAKFMSGFPLRQR